MRMIVFWSFFYVGLMEATALFDFQATSADELTFKKSSVLKVHASLSYSTYVSCVYEEMYIYSVCVFVCVCSL